MTITEFLNARLDEDEAAVGFKYADMDGAPGWMGVDVPLNGIESGDVGAISDVLMISPRRVLSDVEAKRRIIEMTPVVYGLNDPTAEAHHMLVLAHLASVYAGHEDYFVGWKP